MKYLFAISLLLFCSNVFGQNTDSAIFYFNKGIEEKKANRYLTATQAFSKSIKFNPTNADSYLENGMVNILMKRIDVARDNFIKVHELQPSNKIALHELMNIYYNYRQYAKAIEMANKCNSCPSADRLIGMSYFKQQQYMAAEKSLVTALAKNKNDADAMYALARTYLEMEEYAKAMPLLEKAVKMDTSKTSWMYELGLLYYTQSIYKDAVISFKAAAAKGYFQSPDFKENLGYALLYTGGYEEGERLLLELLAQRPGNQYILRDMADIFYRKKEYDKSLEYCDKLMGINPKDWKALYQAGLNFQKKGNNAKGQYMCDLAIKNDPTLESLRRKKEMMGL